MKKIGFLSFGHWTPSPQSQTRSARDALLQSIDLAVAAEELGADGAYFRVHHFARQLASPFPLLAAVGAKTSRIEIGTAVIDMRYENPLYMAEDAGAADLIAGGRLQLGISRGSPEQVIDGWRYFGYAPAEGQTEADMARRHAEVLLDVLQAARASPSRTRGRCSPTRPACCASSRIRRACASASGGAPASNATAVWAAQARHEPAELDAEGRRDRRALPRPAGRADPALSGGLEGGRAMRASPASRSAAAIFALVDDRDRAYFGHGNESGDQIGFIDENMRRRSSAAATPPSRTRWSSSSRRTRRSRRPTRCC